MSEPIITQRKWRIAGGIILVCAGLMAWNGVEELQTGHSMLYLLGYWTLFVGLLLAAFYIVILDLRYIRLQYLLGQRQIFHSTIGSEDFRRALGEAERRRSKQSSSE